MHIHRSILLTGAALLVAACDIRVDEDAEAAGATGPVTAEGKSEEGQLSVSAPGFKMKIDIPESLRNEARMDDHNGLIHPNARLSGIHVEGGRGSEAGRDSGEVELRFTSSEAPEAVARWYVDPARASDFTIGNQGRDGSGFTLAGTTREDGGNFRVRLTSRSGGGTDGRLVLSDDGR